VTKEKAIAKVRQKLLARYPSYWELSGPERMLLAASVLVNDFAVGEHGGNNHGEWVEAILAAVNLPEGYAWCTAMIELCQDIAKYECGPSDRASAAVINWYNWAKECERLRTTPKRGYMCGWLKPNGKGHGGLVADVFRANSGATIVRSYQGNTSAPAGENERDGDGAYCKSQPATVWEWYIDLSEATT
jgi:hypothetical protein